MKKFFALTILASLLLAACTRSASQAPAVPPTTAAAATTAPQQPTTAPTGTPTGTPVVTPDPTRVGLGAQITPSAQPTEVPTETPAATSTQAVTESTSPQGGIPEDTSWRVWENQGQSWAPQEGYVQPGFGVALGDENITELGIAVGVEMTFETITGTLRLQGGCQQTLILPGTYARDMGGTDWGLKSWWVNLENTHLQDEAMVLSWEAARQQVEREECPDLPDDELLDHVYVVTQVMDEYGMPTELVNVTPWEQFRWATGEDQVRMFAPGSDVVGWTIYGPSGEVLCDGGDCVAENTTFWGWVGGGVVNPWEGEYPSSPRYVTDPVVPIATPVPF